MSSLLIILLTFAGRAAEGELGDEVRLSVPSGGGDDALAGGWQGVLQGSDTIAKADDKSETADACTRLGTRAPAPQRGMDARS